MGILHLEPGHLDWRAVFTLGASLRSEDRAECLEGDPFRMLATADRHGGQAYTALKWNDALNSFTYEDILGAYGWTAEGTIWSVWRNLSREESLSVLVHTPLWVRGLVVASEWAFLHNHVSSTNLPALAWLKASKCFDFTPEEDLVVDEVVFHRFQTKPLEALP